MFLHSLALHFQRYSEEMCTRIQTTLTGKNVHVISLIADSDMKIRMHKFEVIYTRRERRRISTRVA